MSARRRASEKKTPVRKASRRGKAGTKGAAPSRAAKAAPAPAPAAAAPRRGTPRAAVGDRVLVRGARVGTVRYVGITAKGKGTWVGVELEKAGGDCDGSVGGTSHFRCARDHPYSDSHRAACLIQASSRQRLARKRIDEEMNWRMFNVLDEDDEQMHIERRQKLLAAGLVVPTQKLRSLPDEYRDLEDVKVEEEYDGARITFPLTSETVLDMLNHFKHGRKLHYKYAMRILLEFKRLGRGFPTLNRISVPEGSQLTICGDLHGQLQDLFSILTINGLPNRSSNRYLFNGDMVDRGDFGCEVALTIMAFKLLYPGSVHINRGNHEDCAQNETAGFMAEVLRKYRHGGSAERGSHLYALFQAAFEALPIATLIDGKVFVMHGGLFRRKGVRLAHIEAVHRRRAIPVQSTRFEDTVFEDLMWSDPRPMEGSTASDRGAGVFWGEDFTRHWCLQNKIEFIVRSHECVPDGFKFHHGNRVMTLFSASRYMGTYRNKGAFLVLEPGLRKNLQQFIAHSMGAVDLQAESAASAMSALRQEQEIMSMVVQRVVHKKPELYWFLTAADTDHTGHVSRLEWADALKTVLGLELPYMHLSRKLCDIEDDGGINYGRFLDRYRIEMGPEHHVWQDRIVERICEELFKTCSNLEEAYKVFDVDDDGKIAYDEFVDTLNSMGLGMSEMQMYELMATIDRDRDSHIDFAEFAQRFRVVFTAVAQTEEGEAKDDKPLLLRGGLPPPKVHTGLTAPSEASWRSIKLGQTPTFESYMATVEETKDEPGTGRRATLASLSGRSSPPGGAGGGKDSGTPGHMAKETRDALTKIGSAMLQTGAGAKDLFHNMDKNGDGVVSPVEFSTAVKELGMRLPKSVLKAVVLAIDTNASGRINYREFMSAFRIADFGGSAAARARAARREHKRGEAEADSGSDSGGEGASSAGAGAGFDDDEPMEGHPPWEQRVIDRIVTTLYSYREELAAVFRMSEGWGEGRVPVDKFREGLSAVRAALSESLTELQVDEVVRGLDRNGDGFITYNEFFSAFTLVDTQTGARSLPPNPPLHHLGGLEAPTLGRVATSTLGNSSPLARCWAGRERRRSSAASGAASTLSGRGGGGVAGLGSGPAGAGVGAGAGAGAGTDSAAVGSALAATGITVKRLVRKGSGDPGPKSGRLRGGRVSSSPGSGAGSGSGAAGGSRRPSGMTGSGRSLASSGSARSSGSGGGAGARRRSRR